MPTQSIVFIDTETTNLPEKGVCEIVEYCLAEWQDGEIKRLDSKLVMPKVDPSPEVCAINGFERQLWAAHGALSFSVDDVDLINSYLPFGSIVGGSNPRFDKDRIAEEFKRLGKPTPKWSHRTIDTGALGSLLWLTGAVESTGLVALAKHFGVEHAAHTAEGDVRATIAVFEKFFDLYVYKPRLMREALQEIAARAGQSTEALCESIRNVCA